MLHDDIITMRVNLQISTFVKSPVQAEGSSTADRAVGSDSVYDSVRSLIEPLPFIDPDISIINSFFIITSSNDLINNCFVSSIRRILLRR